MNEQKIETDEEEAFRHEEEERAKKNVSSKSFKRKRF
jgi:hypothetical protein